MGKKKKTAGQRLGRLLLQLRDFFGVKVFIIDTDELSDEKKVGYVKVSLAMRSNSGCKASVGFGVKDLYFSKESLRETSDDVFLTMKNRVIMAVVANYKKILIHELEHEYLESVDVLKLTTNLGDQKKAKGSEKNKK